MEHYLCPFSMNSQCISGGKSFDVTIPFVMPAFSKFIQFFTTVLEEIFKVFVYVLSFDTDFC